MAIKVSIPSSGSAVKVSIPSSGSAVRLGTTVTTGSKRVTSANVEQLNNVDTTTNGLEDGFTIVYDLETGKWVTQAALMDSEVDVNIKTLVLPASTTISTFGASLVDDLTNTAARTTLGVDVAGTDNSTDVTKAGTGTYVSLAGQVLTVDPITESDISDLGSYQPLATVLTNTTASFLIADETKLDFVAVTQAVDLDTMELRVNALDTATVLAGAWDASAGTFPSTTTAGMTYIVSVAGTVGGIAFNVDDRLLALVNNPSTTVYATNWLILDYTDKVLSVAGRTGAVVLAKTDVGLSSIDNTSDANKPVSTAQQTAFNLKANLASPTFTGTVAGVTKTMVGLSNVTNTSDANKPVSTAQQTALNLKLDDSQVGVSVMAYDSTMLVDADIGSSVQAYTAVLQGTQQSFTTTLKTKLDGITASADVNDPTTVLDADIGVNVQAYTAVLQGTQQSFTTILKNKLDGISALAEVNDITTLLDADIGVNIQAFDSTIVVDADIGSTVQAYDANLTSFVTALTLPTADGSAGQALLTNGSGSIAFGDVDALPSQTGNSGKYLSTNGTDPSWATVGEFVYTRTLYTATSGQTAFTATYAVGYVDVFLNGIKILLGTEFTATNGTSITLATGATTGDLIEILAHSTYNTIVQLKNADGGFANSTYTSVQSVNGGSA
jgi:hypothetical protein